MVTDTMSAGVMRVSADLKYVWVNRVFASWTGWAPERDHRPPGRRGDRRGRHARVPPVCRAPARRPSAWTTSAARVSPACGALDPHRGGADLRPAGTPDGWVAVSSDIQSRKEAEAALDSAREQLQLVADSMPAAVALCSRDLRYVWVNRRCAEWLGATPQEVDRAPDRRDQRRRAASMRCGRISSACWPARQVEYERLTRLRRHGRALDAQSLRADAATVRAGSRSAPTSTTASSSEETLREADRRKDEFLATLAHELRNPLAPIRNAVAILGKTGRARSRARLEPRDDRAPGRPDGRAWSTTCSTSRASRSGKLALRKERVAAASA